MAKIITRMEKKVGDQILYRYVSYHLDFDDETKEYFSPNNFKPKYIDIHPRRGRYMLADFASIKLLRAENPWEEGEIRASSVVYYDDDSKEFFENTVLDKSRVLKSLGDILLENKCADSTPRKNRRVHFADKIVQDDATVEAERKAFMASPTKTILKPAENYPLAASAKLDHQQGAETKVPTTPKRKKSVGFFAEPKKTEQPSPQDDTKNENVIKEQLAIIFTEKYQQKREQAKKSSRLFTAKQELFLSSNGFSLFGNQTSQEKIWSIEKIIRYAAGVDESNNFFKSGCRSKGILLSMVDSSDAKKALEDALNSIHKNYIKDPKIVAEAQKKIITMLANNYMDLTIEPLAMTPAAAA